MFTEGHESQADLGLAAASPPHLLYSWLILGKLRHHTQDQNLVSFPSQVPSKFC